MRRPTGFPVWSFFMEPTMAYKHVHVSIKKADNGGWIVTACNEKGEKAYTYKDLSDATKEIESIFNVAETEDEEED